MTSPEDARQAASQFPDVTHLILPNLTHVTAWTYSDIGLMPSGGDLTHCVQGIVRNFVKNLRTGDTSCVAKIRAIRTPPKFARAFTELTPVDATAGNKASTRELKLAAAALETVGDVMARWYVTYGYGSGLRGGEFTYELTNNGYAFDLVRVAWTEDIELSGSITWNHNTDAVVADVKVFKNGERIGRLDIKWDDAQRNAIATVSGTIDGSRVEAKRIAP